MWAWIRECDLVGYYISARSFRAEKERFEWSEVESTAGEGMTWAMTLATGWTHRQREAGRRMAFGWTRRRAAAGIRGPATESGSKLREGEWERGRREVSPEEEDDRPAR
jgi:hypothetical protein